MIADGIQVSRAGLGNPGKPIGVFLLAGTSGVGKTETALALAEALYGGEHNAITINMSEFQEAHTVSKLLGSPPGYVDSDQGGLLTESVRRRPHSVLLLDEIEKAHPDVHEVFFQIFQRGWIEDSRGLGVDFRNTIILLTSNVGSELITNMCKDPKLMPSPKGLADALHEPLRKVFAAAFLGRLTVVPYFPIGDEVLRSIIELQLRRVADRLRTAHKIPFKYDPSVADLIAARCTEGESGARAVDAIINHGMLPRVSKEFLTRLSTGETVGSVQVGAVDGEFTYVID
jgi:type VI secretion system protein VasG